MAVSTGHWFRSSLPAVLSDSRLMNLIHWSISRIVGCSLFNF